MPRRREGTKRPSTADPNAHDGPTVVLVHGAWHGAWCWEPVVEGLARRGVAALAVDLPGHGADPGPLGDCTPTPPG